MADVFIIKFPVLMDAYFFMHRTDASDSAEGQSKRLRNGFKGILEIMKRCDEPITASFSYSTGCITLCQY